MAGRRPWIWCSEFMRLLQTNLGRSRRAQDLLSQTIRESGVALAVVAEPYCIPDVPDWVGDLNSLVAVAWTPTMGALGPCSIVAAIISPSSGRMEWCLWWTSMFPLTAAWARLRTFWTGLENASGDTFPARCSSWGTSMPTLRNEATPERTHVGGYCQTGPQD